MACHIIFKSNNVIDIYNAIMSQINILNIQILDCIVFDIFATCHMIE